ncbi:pyruvate formate-lyase activating enzyme [Desulforamulus reducens MI-1]|uniref:Pyruvate formate-lyase-activating enzyme n=1 Tax=Desulforamulus reducens (strain ATCC BAA-1160 / DSM 100696 / MI-1) TaxID=349161 RepID=A4J0I5_DESRM|nr:pyruvate formate-lyase-activating protein [Desulforamulus reducens]ABO48588.1 pyruvate formate-lyase activating enzyme [Desulforamulus reducens MI-1]
MKGRIHSFESCGTVDGPGIRCVVFFQGCLLRCRYCHNPDTWDLLGGQEMDSDEIVKKVRRFKSYFHNNGGITLSGGEPLLQPDFAFAILQQCKKEGIHTAVDTSGCIDVGALEKILPFTDLLLLDVKAVDDSLYHWLTGGKAETFQMAVDYIRQQKTPLWLRYVVLPGMNDSPEYRYRLEKLINSLGDQVKKVELLPYHTMGVHKWKKLGLVYPLNNLKPATASTIANF